MSHQMAVDVLVLGQGPHPPDFEPGPDPALLRHTPFTVQRLWQGVKALVASDLTVAVVAEGAGSHEWQTLKSPTSQIRWFDLGQNELATDLPNRLLNEVEPRCVVTLGPFAPARAGAGLAGSIPILIDLPGDPMAEAQLRAEESVEHLHHYRSVLKAALHRADAFSVCSPNQRLALMGQLGLSGRLTPQTTGSEPIFVFPPSLDDVWAKTVSPSHAHPLPPGDHLALIGSTNTWFDWPTVVIALGHALTKAPMSHVVVLGGPVDGFCESRHQAFQEAVRAHSWSSRVHFLGWQPPDTVMATLDQCTAAICLDRPCAEAELGARTRLLLGIARGLRWVVTPLSDMEKRLVDIGLGVGVPPGDGLAAGKAVIDLLSLGRLSRGEASRWSSLVPGHDAQHIVDWVKSPKRLPLAPDSLRDVETANRLALEEELAAVHGSATWRLLGALHRKARGSKG